jgi:hypothetical protein
MSDQATISAIEQARSLFAAQKLPFPFIPEHLARRLRPSGDRIFTTIERPMGPYMVGAYSGPVIANSAHEDFALVGFDGHGFNSWAAHYFLVETGLALFVQQAWGGAYMDAEEERPAIEQTFAWSARLRELVAAALAAGHIPPGWRLVVVLSAFGTSGWGWVPSPSPGFKALDWRMGADADVKAQTLQTVEDVINRKMKLG